MKTTLTYALLSLLTLFLLVKPIYAQNVTNPPVPTPTQNNVETTQNVNDEATGAFKFLNGLFSSFSRGSALGGLVFTTPDMFPQNNGDILMPDGSHFTNFDTFRIVFEIIGGSIVAIVLSVIGINIAVQGYAPQINQLILRFILAGFLLIGTPFILRQSILGVNVFNTEIGNIGEGLIHGQKANAVDISTIPTMVFTKVQDQISSGQSKPSDFLYPQDSSSESPSFVGLFFKILIFLLYILILSIGFFFIVFQFIARFLALLFLSLLSPLVAPFALSGKTDGFVKAYFQAWIGFLIHQPAFILAFYMIMNIFNGIMASGTVDKGSLFLVVGGLFFLSASKGIINQIFGSPWTGMTTSLVGAASAVPYGMVGGVFGGSLGKLKEGAISGQAKGFRGFAGRSIASRFGWLSPDRKNFRFGGGAQDMPKPPVEVKHHEHEHKLTYTNGVALNNPLGNKVKSANDAGYAGNSTSNHTIVDTTTPDNSFIPSLTREIQGMGVKTQVIKSSSGEIQLEKTPVYSFLHPKEKPLKVNYFSKTDALKDGVREDQLTQGYLEGKFVDYSAFYKTQFRNNHNTHITKMAKGTPYQGLTHGGLTMSEDRVKNSLIVGKDYFAKKEIKGIVGKRCGNNNGVMNENEERIVKIYTLDE